MRVIPIKDLTFQALLVFRSCMAAYLRSAEPVCAEKKHQPRGLIVRDATLMNDALMIDDDYYDMVFAMSVFFKCPKFDLQNS